MNKKKVSLTSLDLSLLTIKSLYAFSNIFYVEIIDNIFLGLVLILSTFIIFKRRYSTRRLVLFFIIGALLITSCYLCGSWHLLLTYLAALLISGTEFNKSLKLINRIKIYFLAFHLILSIPFYFINPSVVITNYYGDIRARFLFTHPNTFAMTAIAIIYEWIWLKWDKIKLKHYITMSLFLIFIFITTETDSVLLMMIIGLIAVINRTKVLNKLFFLVARYGILVATFACWSAGYLYLNASGSVRIFINLLDAISSRRIAILALAQSMNTIKLFSSTFNVFEGYNSIVKTFGVTALDNVFFSIIYNYGLFYIFVLAAMFWYLSGFKDSKINFYLASFVIYGLIEGQVIISLIFPSLLLLAIPLYPKKEFVLKLKENGNEYYSFNRNL